MPAISISAVKSFDGPHWDTYFQRDLGTVSKNPDVRALDHMIDTIAASGAVDARRIYVIGWSNGAFFAHLYGIARSVAPTPGKHYVAAVVGFAGADPFAGMEDGENPSCALAPYPSSDVAILDVHRSCDALVACDEAQRVKFHFAAPAIRWSRGPGDICDENRACQARRDPARPEGRRSRRRVPR